MDGEIGAGELVAALDADEPPLIVDIRSPHEFERERIQSSINIPLGDLPSRIDEVADADHVVTVCPHGKASVQAANLIDSFEGFNGRVESLAPGLSGWNGPVATSRESEPESPDAPF